MDRPEHVDFILGVAHTANNDTLYRIDFRAWQLRDLKDYIKELERKVERHGQQ
jgi:hypothetical protein